MVNKFNHQKGFAALLVAILILAIVFSIGTSVFILSYGEQKIVKNIIKSSQAYYAAEASAEDALLRLVKELNWSSPYKLQVGDNWATATISNIIGGSRTITSEGDAADRIRKIQIVYEITSEKVAFHYATQVGDGGLKMSSGSEIHDGNVFSNGSIVPDGSGQGLIDGDAYVAYNGNRIEGVEVIGNGYAFSFEDCKINGDAHYVSGGSIASCIINGETQIQPNQFDPRPMPITSSQIQAWKDEAASGGTADSVNSNTDIGLGPVKINGNLRIYGNGQLVVDGTIWVTGDLTVEDNARVGLSSLYFGNSGIIIVDGKILLKNNAIIDGSGQAGSYLMLLSDNDSVDDDSPAFLVKNNAKGTIFYASKGLMIIENNAELREVTAYKLYLKNNVKINYQTGLQDNMFSAGPGGSWQAISWKEVE